jgi:hypothetical protein
VGFIVLLPVVLVVAAFVVSYGAVRASSLCITSHGIEFRNYPQPPRTVPLDDVERFVETERVGIIAGLRPATAALWMRDGSRVPIRSVRDCSGAHGVDALNARLADERRQRPA